MKKIVLVLICVFVLLTAGCVTDLGGAANSIKSDTGMIVVYVDEDTGVNYLTCYRSYANGIGGGMSPRYNADGTLMVTPV